MKDGAFPQARRHTIDINDFIDEFETTDHSMWYREYVVLGKKKDTGELVQACIIRTSKDGIEGGFGEYDWKNTFSEIALYRIIPNFKFKKLSDDQKDLILALEKTTTDYLNKK